MSYHETMADRQEAYELGRQRPELAWVATDRDVWHANPFYKGPPVRHPEDDSDAYEDDVLAGTSQPEASLLDDEGPF